MADDARPEARDPEVARLLQVEPLDDVTRRRLVSTALREAVEPAKAPSRAWRWIAAAAAVVLVGGVTVAVVTAGGGNDEQRASTPVQSPKGAATRAPQYQNLGAVPDVGDFGNLDQPANMAKVRAALKASSSAPAASDSAAPQAEAAAGASAAVDQQNCGSFLPGGVVTAQATGTLDGRPTVIYLVVHTDGSRSYVAVLDTPCEIRQLP
jgi:hypothetical protein